MEERSGFHDWRKTEICRTRTRISFISCIKDIYEAALCTKGVTIWLQNQSTWAFDFNYQKSKARSANLFSVSGVCLKKDTQARVLQVKELTDRCCEVSSLLPSCNSFFLFFGINSLFPVDIRIVHSRKKWRFKTQLSSNDVKKTFQSETNLATLI